MKQIIKEAGLLGLGRVGVQIGLFWSAKLQMLCADDYLRLSVATGLVEEWKWFPDPIFLPSHFWVYSVPFFLGLPLRVGGIGLTILLAGVLTALVYLVALRLGVSKRVAVIGTTLLSVQPLSLWLGGVPLSETLAATLFLFGLWAWCSQKDLLKWAGSLAMALATLSRYELWPVAGLVSLFALYNGGGSFWKRGIQALLALSGMILYLGWRVTRHDPLGPAKFVYNEVTSSILAHMGGYQVLWGFFAFSFVGVVALAVLPFSLPHVWKKGFAGQLLSVACLSSLGTTVALFAVGYFPITFAVRIIFFPLLLTTLVALPFFENVTHQVRTRSMAIVTVLVSLIFMGLAHFPPVEGKPETRTAAEVIGEILANGEERDVILVERRDLGWVTIWGLNDGDSRIQFDRQHLRLPRRMQDPRWVKKQFARNPHLRCVLGATKLGIKNIQTMAPLDWKVKWREGKYLLLCAPETFSE